MGQQAKHNDGPGASVTIAAAEPGEGHLLVRWGDGHESRFAYGWLRHARAFPSFADDARGDGDFRLPEPSSQLSPAAVALTPDGGLAITWAPGEAASRFEAAWLRGHCPSPRERAKRRRPLVLWDGRLAAGPPEMDYAEAGASDGGRLDLHRRLLDHGFVFLRNVPPREGEVAELAGLFGLARLSLYSDCAEDRRIENVRSDPAVGVSTRLSHFLAPHTDTCWRTSVTGLVCLHCLIAQEAGGDTLLVDGFAVAERLRREDPDAFTFLSTHRLSFRASVPNGDEWRSLGQVITCDDEGHVVGFRFSDRSLPPLDLPEALIEPAYDALAGLARVLYDPDQWMRLRLQPGDAVVTDNQRVLHGRSQFDPAAGPRHLQHCAVERDSFHNNYRQLARAQGDPDWDQILPWGLC